MNLEEVLYIHHRVIEDYGGIHGVRDSHRLKSAVHKFSEQTDPLLAASYVVRDIIEYHPFTDGNKRTAVTVMAIYLARNNIALVCSPMKLEEFAVAVAATKMTIHDIAQWLRNNTSSPDL